MTYTTRAKFTSADGKIFLVDEVIQGPAGLTVYYHNEANNERYSCLLEAFSERFKELVQ